MLIFMQIFLIIECIECRGRYSMLLSLSPSLYYYYYCIPLSSRGTTRGALIPFSIYLNEVITIMLLLVSLSLSLSTNL